MVDGAAMGSRKTAQDDSIRISLGESGYPVSLASISEPPAELYLRGELPDSPWVAIVGSRRADAYGLRMASELGASMAANGVCVVSGGAAGVDTAALTGCLENGGNPVAVLGTGVDVAYPTANRDLFNRLVARGALVSEHPPGTPGLAHHFPKRNRIVSGLSMGVVVVRAAGKSGSLITARLAAKQGRILMAVPGLAGEELSAGTHDLLRSGAKLVESGKDILEALGIPGGAQRRLALVSAPPELDGDELLLYEALEAGDGPIDVLTARSGMSSATASSVLLQMELKGLVIQKPGMVYCLKRMEASGSGLRQEGA
jgi:DNA processing protein